MADTAACPFCAEDIRPDAVKCKHCGEWLDERALDRLAGRPGPARTVIVADRRGSPHALAALASFFVPGLGQLIQARVLPALAFFALACLAWLLVVGSLGTLFLVGLAVNVWAVVDAARWDGIR